MADMIKFYKGALANLPASGTNGALYITTDEGAIYLGTGVGMKRLGDFVQVDAVANLPESANQSALYYCVAENVLAKWTGTEWKQVNKQPTKDELKVMLGLDAEGDVTKAIAAAQKAGDDAQADVDTLTEYVGTFTHDTAKTVVEYINAKTDGIATSGNLEALGSRVTAVEGDVATIKGDYLKAADKTELAGDIETAQTAADNAQLYAEGVASDLADHEKDTVAHITAAEREAWNGKTTMTEVEAKGYLVAGDIAGKADSAQVALDIAAAVQTETDNRVAADDAIKASIGTVAEGKTVVQMIADAQTAATYDDEEVRGLISDNADAIAAETEARGELKTDLEGKIDAKVAQADYDTKVAALDAEDARLSGLIGAMDTAYKAADEALDARIADLESDITGLSGAMHFKGVVEALPESTEGYSNGDVVVCGQKEYVVNGEAFVELGDVSSEVQRISDLEGVVGNAESGLVKAVADNAAAITTEKERAEAKEAELVKADEDNLKAAKDYADAEITKLSIGDYAKQADLDAATGRITTAEGKISALEGASATHATKTEVEAVSTALSEYKTAHEGDYTNAQIDAAIKVVSDDLAAYEEAHASDYTNDQINTAIANAGHASATDLATHTGNEDIHVTTADKDKWNGAQAAAEATAAAALATARTEISAEIDADVLVETNRAKGVEEGLQTAIDTVSGDLADYETANDAAVALKANSSDVYTKTEVETLLTWGSF